MRVALALLCVAMAAAETIQYRPVPREILRQRLELAAKHNRERLSALTQLFDAVGCKGPDMQPILVKGSRLVNAACTLPGESADTILVGATMTR